MKQRKYTVTLDDEPLALRRQSKPFALKGRPEPYPKRDEIYERLIRRR